MIGWTDATEIRHYEEPGISIHTYIIPIGRQRIILDIYTHAHSDVFALWYHKKNTLAPNMTETQSWNNPIISD